MARAPAATLLGLALDRARWCGLGGKLATLGQGRHSRPEFTGNHDIAAASRGTIDVASGHRRQSGKLDQGA